MKRSVGRRQDYLHRRREILKASFMPLLDLVLKRKLRTVCGNHMVLCGAGDCLSYLDRSV